MNSDFDMPFYKRYGAIAGIDESGVTAIAGPIVSACVAIFQSQTPLLQDVDDCKKITDKKLPGLAALIKLYCPYGIGVSSPLEIDILGVAKATELSMMRALESCAERFPDNPIRHYLIDGKQPIRENYAQTAIPGGDTKSLCIGAASIIAKDRRDTLMTLLGEQRPEYNFAKNKGYASEEHLQGLDHRGLWVSVHRICTAPIKAKKSDSRDLIARRATWIANTLGTDV